MHIETHNDGKIAEVISSDILINGPEEGKRIQDFIYESNKGRQVNFLGSPELVVEKLSA